MWVGTVGVKGQTKGTLFRAVQIGVFSHIPICFSKTFPGTSLAGLLWRFVGWYCGWTKSCTTLTVLDTLFVGIYRGIESFQGFLGGAKWISSIHSMVGKPNFSEVSAWMSLQSKNASSATPGAPWKPRACSKESASTPKPPAAAA